MADFPLPEGRLGNYTKDMSQLLLLRGQISFLSCLFFVNVPWRALNKRWERTGIWFWKMQWAAASRMAAPHAYVRLRTVRTCGPTFCYSNYRTNCRTRYVGRTCRKGVISAGPTEPIQTDTADTNRDDRSEESEPIHQPIHLLYVHAVPCAYRWYCARSTKWILLKSGTNPRTFQSRMFIRDSPGVCIGRVSAMCQYRCVYRSVDSHRAR